MYAQLFTTKTVYNNSHHLSRYLKFISSRTTTKRKYETHLHHILPKATDMFPEYKNLKEFKWNGIYLTLREHFIAHRLLHKAFPGSSQSLAFYNMANELNICNSKSYAEAREVHIQSLKKLHASPERNAKIGAYWKGRKRPNTFSENMKGHVVTEQTRAKLRAANLGKKASAETRKKISDSAIGKVLGEQPLSQRKNISEAKKGTKLYNNGIINKHFKGVPDSTWTPGKLK
jgi:hypothetical protein